MLNTKFTRACAAAVALLAAGAVVSAAPATAGTQSTMSTKYIVNHLPGGSEHVAGYVRSKFVHWGDADGDGCDARNGGSWWSAYDGAKTTDASSFDVDHMIPLNEAWQSGAWNWSAAKREAYANDLGYKHSLIAVSASSNRSKGDREPQDWMPIRASYTYLYAKRWAAVKWRWQLKVNPVERAFSRRSSRRAAGRACPSRAAPPSQPRAAGVAASREPAGAAEGGGGGLDPRFDFCYSAIDAGYGPYYRRSDPEHDWYTDADGDGVACE